MEKMITVTAYEIATIIRALRFQAAMLSGGTFNWPTPLPKSENILAIAEQIEQRYFLAVQPSENNVR